MTNNKSYEIEAHSPLLDKNQLGETMQAELIAVGIPRDPWDFLARAVEAGPRSLAVHLNDGVQNMLRENFSEEPHKVVKARAQFLKTWTARCKELETAERELHNGLEPHLKSVSGGKRLLLFKEILTALQYPDTELVDTICKGFPLTGWMPKSHVFPPHMKRPTHSLDAAKRLAKGVNNSIVKQVSEQADPELAAEVWNQSLDEVSKGWTWFDDDSGMDGKILAKRFGLKQGDKIRMIDDCSIGGFNATCGTSEKLKVHAVDEIAAYMCWCMTNLGKEAMQQVVGKTYDLKNAYKQYGVRPQDRDLLRIAVWDHAHGRVRLMGTNALPFGAVGSVGAGLRLCWTSFFDDFTLLSKRVNCNSAAVAAESLFSLLGVQFAKEGKKAVEWATKVKTLGVVLDLEPADSSGNYVTLGHTESRVAELRASLESFLQTGKMSRKDAEKLRGRLQWFESFAHGRIAQQSLRVISQVASTGREKETLTKFELNTIAFLKDRVLTAPPTRIHLTAPPTRIQTTNLDTWLVFTDGACEGEDEKCGTIGAVLVAPNGTICSYISAVVPEGWMSLVLQESNHPIFELELLPVWVALHTWKAFLSHVQCVFFLDNEAAKGALIRAAASTSAGQAILSGFVSEEMNCQIKVWFSREPTASNISDNPSRLQTDEMDALGVNRSDVAWQDLWKLLGDYGSRHRGFEAGSVDVLPIC